MSLKQLRPDGPIFIKVVAIPLIWRNFILCWRYKNAVHLETKNVGSDHKQRYIVVSKVKDEFDFKRREAAKQEAEWVC